MVSVRAAAKRAHRLRFARRALAAALAAAVVVIAGAAPAPGQGLASGEGIVFESTRDGNSEIYAMTPDGAVQVRLTNNGALDAAPAISNGGRIAFATNRDGNWNLYLLGSRGKDAPVRVGPAIEFGPAWSPDGHTIAFARSGSDPGLSEIQLYDRSTGEERPLTQPRGPELRAELLAVRRPRRLRPRCAGTFPHRGRRPRRDGAGRPLREDRPQRRLRARLVAFGRRDCVQPP